jgi:general secretion pathway protein I
MGTCAAHRARGFTMIEVLVALAIVAIALAASMRAVGNLATSQRDLHERLLAGWSADNELSSLHLAHTWPNIGKRSYDCSQGNVQLVCTDTVGDTPNPLFRRVVVTVQAPGRPGDLVQLVTVLANETMRSL